MLGTFNLGTIRTPAKTALISATIAVTATSATPEYLS